MPLKNPAFGHIGTKLRKAREKMGLSQAEVAKRMGSSQSTLSIVEQKGANASSEFIRKYLEACKKPPSKPKKGGRKPGPKPGAKAAAVSTKKRAKKTKKTGSISRGAKKTALVKTTLKAKKRAVKATPPAPKSAKKMRMKVVESGETTRQTPKAKKKHLPSKPPVSKDTNSVPPAPAVEAPAPTEASGE